ncbi:hypothetical protein HZS_7066 [Henneguya salminicola]|nr:hypothetical protein HZS_7066 [Henneguya salminicola]
MDFNIIMEVFGYEGSRGLIDRIEIQDIPKYPNLIYSMKNLTGIHNNIKINILLGFACQKFTGEGCSLNCQGIDNIERCSYKKARVSCINGAKDRKTCENQNHKCLKDTCNRNGKCILRKNKIKCICIFGFTGKYCNKFSCVNKCHGNGYCVGPNTCNCYPPYHGEHCNEYPCEPLASPCLNTGDCYIYNNSNKCYCKKDHNIGLFCERVVCPSNCSSRTCKLNKRTNQVVCLCKRKYCSIYVASSVDIYIPIFLTSAEKIPLILVGTVLVPAIILSVMILCLVFRKSIIINRLDYLSLLIF